MRFFLYLSDLEILGDGSESIYGGTFNDENFQIKHDQAYLFSMDNQGPNTNGSQFFNTTSEVSHLDGKHVVFGHVVSGQLVVDVIDNVPIDTNGRPSQDVVIDQCGQLILCSNILTHKTTIDLDVISNIPAGQFVIQQNLNDDDNNNETSHARGSNTTVCTIEYDNITPAILGFTADIRCPCMVVILPLLKRLKTAVLRRNTMQKRQFTKYTGKSRSRSCTPPHWRSTVKDRKREHVRKEKYDNNKEDFHSHRLVKRRNDHHHHQTESTSQHEHQPTRTNDQHQENDSRSYRRRHSSSPIDDQFEINNTQSYQIEYVNTIRANPASSSSKKRREYWEKHEESNEQPSLAQIRQYARLDNQLRMIAQTTAAQLKSTSHDTNILQQSSGQTAVYESKRNDEYDVSFKENANDNQRSYSFTSSSRGSRYDQDKKTETPTVGQIYILRKSVEEVLGCTLKSSASFSSLNSLASSSSSSTTTTKRYQKCKPRPCVVWDAKPKVQVLLITTFDGIDIDDPNFNCGSLPIDYVRKQLVPISPKKGFGVPVEEDTEWNKLLPQYFDENDLLYINDLLFNKVTEENKQKAKEKQEEIKKISYNFILNDNNDDDDDISDSQTGSSSIPISRTYKSPDIDSNEKVKIIRNRSFDDEDQQTTSIEGLVDQTKDNLLLPREK
ncbi:unnamed protein product [Rotaria magnacalcarata]|uniref:PPIase cyclophilin-type domain-containing protein n=1 Tax=Rotaria magnacalcarata TaxID=392030 RepID=A0A816EY10_9BILA|nr:unnamed protein product [Rotaria magnacalcarata]